MDPLFLQFLCSHPEVVLHTVGQWRWGCSVAKPTGLLALRLPFFNASMYSRQSSDAQKSKEVAIGVGDNGVFKTSARKEYSPGFCDALAGTLIDKVYKRQHSAQCQSTEPDPQLQAWLREASAQCNILRNAGWLPGYQGS